MGKRANEPARDETRATGDDAVHEATTAQREWPKELLESVRSQIANNATPETRATTKMTPPEVDTAMRPESGTRPVVSREEIDRYTRERLARLSALPEPYATDAPTLPPPDTSGRPTLDAAPAFVPISIEVDLSELAPAPPARSRRDIFVLIAISLMVLAAIVGFLAGRLTS